MGGLFPKPPKPPAPVAMPDPEDASVREAQRRRQAEMQARGGRDSTILSEGMMQTAGKMGA